MVGSGQMITIVLDGGDMGQKPDPAVRRAVRQQVLAGAVRMVRTARGWSVNDTAAQAGVAPMTWRRVADGLDVRRKAMTAIDGVLNLPFGTAARALDDDLVTL